MNRLRKRILFLIPVIIVVFAAVLLIYRERQPEQDVFAQIKPLGENDMLKVREGKLYTEDGRQIILRGVNLGGWLLQENWMCPVTGGNKTWANLDTLQILERRFSREQVQEIYDVYQDNWITEEDIRDIAGRGLNVVRVPFWYRNFMSDAEGTWIAEPDENPGFQRLDWVIETAGKYGVYVILDMHGCPGGQNMDHSSGTLAKNELYTNPVYQEAMEKLWTEIAKRYRGEPAVAAYDIMNEPQNNEGYYGAGYYDPWKPETWEMSNDIYRRMIDAVRKVDPEHVITIEGIWRVTNLPDPESEGWSNMMYQVHFYNEGKEIAQLIEDTVRYCKDYGVAVYLGEFSNLNALEACEAYGVSWTTWTYKGGNGSQGTWFWYSAKLPNVDPETDSYEEILEKWGTGIRTEHMSGNARVIKKIEEFSSPDR